jgi:hypothetical protein
VARNGEIWGHDKKSREVVCVLSERAKKRTKGTEEEEEEEEEEE